MPKNITEKGCIIVHTDTTQERYDVSFQKQLWGITRRAAKLENLYRVCDQNGIIARGQLAVCSYGMIPGAEFPRLVDIPDKELLDPTVNVGNSIITNNDDIVLMGYSADDCLIGISAKNGSVRAIINASVESVAVQHIIETTIATISRKFGVKPSSLNVYIGACAETCCAIYGREYARSMFIPDLADYICEIGMDNEVAVDLKGAIRYVLKNAGVDDKRITDIYAKTYQCTMCAKKDGNYLHYSHRRMVRIEPSGQAIHYNGYYGLIVAKKMKK